MTKKNLVVFHVEIQPELSLEELCHAAGVSTDFIQELIDYGVIDVLPYQKTFTAEHLRRVRTIANLQHDLEINLAGAALVLELMDEMTRMRARIEWMEKRFL